MWHCVEGLTEINDYKVELFFGVLGFEKIVESDDEWNDHYEIPVVSQQVLWTVQCDLEHVYKQYVQEIYK